MKVLLINGSPHKEGNTYIALHEMEQVFAAEGIETEMLQVGGTEIRPCNACGACSKLGRCVKDDVTNVAVEKFAEADGIVVGAPVYYAGANPEVLAFMTKLFRLSRFEKRDKVGAAVGVARRGGILPAYDQINHYFGIASMPIATSQYWNMIYGTKEGDALEDAEGLQTMRTLAHNMAFLIKSIALGREKYGLPEKEEKVSTHFVR